jgi:hypothetical protein
MTKAVLTVAILLAATQAQAQVILQPSTIPGYYVPLVPRPVYTYPSPPISAFSQPGTMRGGSQTRQANVYQGPHSKAWLHRHGQ